MMFNNDKFILFDVIVIILMIKIFGRDIHY